MHEIAIVYMHKQFFDVLVSNCFCSCPWYTDLVTQGKLLNHTFVMLSCLVGVQTYTKLLRPQGLFTGDIRSFPIWWFLMYGSSHHQLVYV